MDLTATVEAAEPGRSTHVEDCFMSRMTSMLAAVALTMLLVAVTVWAATTVDYGRIASVNLVTQRSSGAQTGGAILGGALGAATASNRGRGTQTARAVGGMVAGQQLGRMASKRQAFEYTITFDGRPNVRIVTDEAGLRVGDCVAVERGNFNNLRLVDDNRCTPNAAATPEAVNEANACMTAKEQLLAATTDEEFDRAERRMRLLCLD